MQISTAAVLLSTRVYCEILVKALQICHSYRTDEGHDDLLLVESSAEVIPLDIVQLPGSLSQQRLEAAVAAEWHTPASLS